MKTLTKGILLSFLFIGHHIFAASIGPETLPIIVIHNTNTPVFITYSGDENDTTPEIPQYHPIEDYGTTLEIATMEPIPGNFFNVTLWTESNDGVFITGSCYYKITIDPEGIAHTHGINPTKTPYGCKAEGTSLIIMDKS